MSDKVVNNVNINANANIKNIRIFNDLLGIGEACQSIPDTINAIGSCVKDISEGYENIVHTTGNIMKAAGNIFGGLPNPIQTYKHSDKALKSGGNFDIKKQSFFAVENMRDIELKKKYF